MTARRVSLKISPQATLRVDAERTVPHVPLLAGEPFAMVGAERVPPMATAGVRPDRASCFGPRGACLLSENGPLLVCDTGHHRVLIWNAIPDDETAPADIVLGQPDFDHEGRNAKGHLTASSLNVPTGICKVGSGFAVADAWNHRVLIWHNVPNTNDTAADIVLGQQDFRAGEPNRGESQAGANRFHWPYGVAYHDGMLFVADSENRRVLVWREVPTRNGQPADFVLGQMDFTCRDENGGGEPTAMSMRWPHSITVWNGNLCVADAGNNRVMVWSGIPDQSGAPCDVVLGQSSADLVDHNQSLYWPRSNTLNMPYGIVAVSDWLIVADTASSRLVGWHIDDRKTNASAKALAGQVNFHEKGDNRWQTAQADSFCWPYAVTAYDDTVIVSDSGNNRVSLWKLAT
ncbi:MAG: hypothetical protein AAGH76_17355 [Pseudomonadota bacterium]